MSCVVQGNGGAQTGPTCADDANVHWANWRLRRFPPLTHVFQANQNLRMGVSEMR